MSAKYLKKDNHNGWDYWYYKDGSELKSINLLRTQYAKQFHNKEEPAKPLARKPIKRIKLPRSSYSRIRSRSIGSVKPSSARMIGHKK